MKPQDLYDDRERELMKPYFDSHQGKPRKKLLQYVMHVDPMSGIKGQYSSPYMMLEPFVTDDDCDLMMNMKLREPIYIEELAKRAGRPVEDVAKQVAHLCELGVLMYHRDENHVDRVFIPLFCVGSMENMMMTFDHEGDHPEQAVIFEHHVDEESQGVGTWLPAANHGFHRVVPMEKELVNESRHLDWEELTWLIEHNADDTYAVCECICRQAHQLMGRGTGEPEYGWCLQLGHSAASGIKSGRAKQISKEEFMAILEESERRGFVHNVANANGPEEIEYICNCDYHSCFEFRCALYTHNPGVTAGNFRAQVDPEKCVACGRCVETCPMNAVKCGQRLSSKSNKVYTYPNVPADHYDFGKKDFHPDYPHERVMTWEDIGTAPCKTACPAHIAVEGYLKLAYEGRYDDALKLIKYNNPLPAVCGAICNRRCEAACTRGTIDNPVAIDEVKKFLADRERNAENRYIPQKIHKKGKKIAIIGSGPAGLSCAYYCAVNGHEVTVFEKSQKIGGMLQYGIPSFRLEKDIIESEIEVIKMLGAEFKTGVEVGKDITIDELRAEGYAAIYLAIGMQGGRKLGVTGEDAEGILSGVQFMHDAADTGVGACHGNVVVVGGGNVAVDVSRTALRSNADTVTQISLETRDIMPAADDEVEEAENEGVKFECGWGPKEILTENGKVTAVVFKKCTSVFNAEGRFAPEYDENDTMEVPCDTLLTAIGQSVEWGDLLKGTNIQLNPNQTVPADSFTYQTSEPDIFAGGDVYSGARFAIDAIAAGKEAAESIQRYVWDGNLTYLRMNPDYKELDKDDLIIGSYDNGGRQKHHVDEKKRLSWSDDRDVFTEQQVHDETKRCLKCGASHVDENICVGCGVCTTRCEFDAIHVRKVYDIRPSTHEQQAPDAVMEKARRIVKGVGRKQPSITAPVGLKNDPNIIRAAGAKYKVVK